MAVDHLKREVPKPKDGECGTCHRRWSVDADGALIRHPAGGAVVLNREYREDDK